MKKTFVSVVVPVYNVEPFLPECVESILAQTWQNYEVILVDDGSTDSSGKMCDDYARKNTRVRVIHKKNGGLSSARNAGIDIALGNYIAFVDSDDAVHPDYLKVLVEIAEGLDADLVACDFNKGEVCKWTEESVPQFETRLGNDMATKAIRLCLERVRKLTGKSVKHWFITELGHEKTERLHLHGIVWGLGNDKKITDNWKYGITFTGYFVNEKTINYITKYMLKIDEKHPKFRGKVLCSAGIGVGYLKREDAKRHVYIPGKTNESYRMRNGGKLNLPIYYRNKIFTEREREKLFLDKIEKGIVYVLGIKINLTYRDWETDRKSTRLNSSHITRTRMPSSA